MTTPTQDPSTNPLAVVNQRRTGELGTVAMAAKAKALVESRYVMAYNRRRSIDQTRIELLNACRRPAFAATAMYRKPVGWEKDEQSGKFIRVFAEGLSIRFAEEAVRAMTNIACDSVTVYEDDDQRTVNISVTDLESNIVWQAEVTIQKTVERSKLKDGQQALSQRLNSLGKLVYLVEATEDEIQVKLAAQVSKAFRTCVLRCVPSDIKEEAMAQIVKTLSDGGTDPREAAKKICDAFAAIGVQPKELQDYLKQPLESVSPAQLLDLRTIYATIKDGEAKWSDYVQTHESTEGNKKPTFTEKPPAPTDDKPADTTQATTTAASTTPPPQTESTPQPRKRAKAPAPPATTPPPQASSQPQTAPPSEPPHSQPAEASPAPTGATAPAGSSRQTLREGLESNGVAWPQFKIWLTNTAFDPDFDKRMKWEDVPEEICAKLLADPARLKKILILYGTKAPNS